MKSTTEQAQIAKDRTALKKISLQELNEFLGVDNRVQKLLERAFKVATDEGHDDSVTMLRDLLDRYFGKPKQQTDVTSGGERIGSTLDLSKLDNEQLGTLAGITKSISNPEGTK